jgi:hypothetical protein
MSSSIGNSLQTGFKVTHRGWQGMIFSAVAGGIAFGLAFSSLLLTHIPMDAVRNVVSELRNVRTAETPMDTHENRNQRLSPQTKQKLQEWLKRAWPLFIIIAVLCTLFLLWLSVGKIRYMSRWVQGESPTISGYIQDANENFVPYVAAKFLATLIRLMGTICCFAAAVNLKVVGAIFIVPVILAVTWFSIRSAFWYNAIVVDHQRVIDGLRKSFQLTDGRMLQIIAISILIGFISWGISLATNLMLGIFQFLPVIGILFGIVLKVSVQLYLNFFAITAFLQFYEDSKGELENNPLPS